MAARLDDGRQLIDLIATFPIALTGNLRQLTRPLAPRALNAKDVKTIAARAC
jgi:hypothetical protein